MIWKHIEVWSAVLSGPTRSDCGGVTHLEFRDIGRRVFFVDAVEADGGRIGLHSSYGYADAIIAAEETARSEGIPVRDLVIGGAA